MYVAFYEFYDVLIKNDKNTKKKNIHSIKASFFLLILVDFCVRKTYNKETKTISRSGTQKNKKNIVPGR